MEIKNLTKDTLIASDAALADTFFSRMIGLLRHDLLEGGRALVITRCRSIHMFFMKFSIDAVFVDKNDIVVGLVKNIRPFMLSPIFFKSSYCVELSAGSIEKSRTEIGDKVSLQ